MTLELRISLSKMDPDRAATDSTTVAGPAVLPLGRGEMVLVVESERERRLRKEEMLAALGYEPVGLEDPADAIAACRGSPDRFNAAVVSHGTPDTDGLQIAEGRYHACPEHSDLTAEGSICFACARRRFSSRIYDAALAW
jgi:PleD family two-component response regulator